MIRNKWKVPNDLDMEIFRVQQSTRTLFGVFSPFHNWFRMKFNWYYKWHLNPYFKTVHYAVLSLYLVLITGTLSYAVISHFKSGQAASTTQQIVQTVDLLESSAETTYGGGYAEVSPYYNYSGSSFSGSKQVYFEAVIKSGNGFPARAGLLTTSGTEIAYVETTSNSYTLVRTAAPFALGDGTYYVGLKGGNAFMTAARMVIVQTGSGSPSKITSTQTQVEMPLGKTFHFDASKYSGTVTAHLETTVTAAGEGSSAITVVLNSTVGSGEPVAAATIACDANFGGPNYCSGKSLKTAAFTITDGADYSISVTLTSATFHGAKLVLDQYSASGISKLQTDTTFIVANPDGTGDFRNNYKWEPLKWQGANVQFTAWASLYSESEAGSADYSVKANGTAVAGLSYQRDPNLGTSVIRSTAFGLSAGDQVLDGYSLQVEHNSGSDYVNLAWITLDITLYSTTIDVPNVTNCTGGSACSFTWSTTGSTPHHYKYQSSIDNGATWSAESANVTSPASWTPPAFKTITQAKIRVIGYDVSNNIIASGDSAAFAVTYGSGSSAIEQQINISTREVKSSTKAYSDGYNYLRDIQYIKYEPSKYTNPSPYFEVSLKVNNPASADDTAYAALFDSSGTIVPNSTLTTKSTTPVLLSSPILNLVDGTYTVRIKMGSPQVYPGEAWLEASRLVVLQSGGTGAIVKTETQIDLAEYQASIYASPATYQTNQKIFYLDPNDFDGTVVRQFYLDATVSGSGTVQLARMHDWGPSYDELISGSTVTASSPTSPPVYQRVGPFTISNAGRYTIKITGSGMNLYGAKLVVIQEGFTKGETYVQMNSFDRTVYTTNTLVDQYSLNHWDSRNWKGNLFYYYNEAVLKSGLNGYNTSASIKSTPTINDSSVTSNSNAWTRVRSNSITIPDTGTQPMTIDTQATGGSSFDVSSSGIIVRIMPPLTFSGNLKDNENGSNLSNKTITLYVDTTSKGTTTTDGSGNFSFTGQTANPGSVITLAIQNESTTNYISQLKSPPESITGIQMYQGKIILSHDSAGPITKDILSQAQNSTSLYDANAVDASYNPIINFNLSCEVYIPDGKKFTPGSYIKAKSLKVTGTAGTGTSFDLGANNAEISGDWTISPDAAFNTTGTVTFIAGDQNVKTGCGTSTCTNDFYNLTKTGTGTITFQQTAGVTYNWMVVSGTFTVDTVSIADLTNIWYKGGVLNNSGIIKLKCTTSTCFDPTNLFHDNGNGTIELIDHGSGNFVSIDMNGRRSFANLKISGGKWSVSDANGLQVNKQFSLTGGEFSTANKPNYFRSFNQTGGTFSGADTQNLTIGGNMAILGGTYSASTKPVIFSMKSSSSINVNGSTLGPTRTVTGSSPSTYIATFTSSVIVNGDLTADNGGSIKANDVMDIRGNFTCVAGTPTKAINLGATTWKLSGNFDLSNCGSVTPTGSTLEFIGGNGVTQYITLGSKIINHLKHSGAGALIANSDMTLNGTYSQSAGTFTAGIPGTPRTITVKGDFLNTGGSFIHNNGTVVLGGTNQTISGANTFYNFTKANNTAVVSYTLTFPTNAEQTVLNSINLQGSSSYKLNLVPSPADGSIWSLRIPTTFTLANLAINHSTNTGVYPNLNPTTSTDGGSNTNWFTQSTPASPSNITINSVTATGFTANWTDNSSNETGFRVSLASTSSAGQCSVSSGTYAQVGSDTAANATNLPIGSLSVNSLYCVKVEAANGAGLSGAAYSTATYTAANAPSLQSVTASAEETLNVKINQNSNPASTQYAIQRTNFDSSTCWLDKASTSGCGASQVWGSYTDWGGSNGFDNNGLTPNKSYSYKVQAKNGDNIQTALSSSQGTYTLANRPPVPTINFEYSEAQGYHIDVTINPGENPFGTQYLVAYALQETPTSFVLYSDYQTSLTYTLSTTMEGSLDPSKTYYIAIGAINSLGVATDLSDSASTTPVPAAPVVSHSNTVNSITWSWPAVTYATSYAVYSGNHLGSESPLACTITQNGANYQCVDGTYGPNTAHSVHVHAVNASGAGPASNVATAYTSAAIPSLSLSIVDGLIQPTIGENGNPTSVSYSITCNQSGANPNKFLNARGECYSTTPTYRSASLWGGTKILLDGYNIQHGYKVYAKNTDGDLVGGSTTYQIVSPANVPGVPTLQTHWDLTDKYHIHAAFDANSNPAGTEYLVEYNTAATGTYLMPYPANQTNWSTSTSYLFKKDNINVDLLPNTRYWIKVAARNSNQVETALSNYAEIVTPPAKPTNLTDSNVCASTATLTWTAPTGATEYKIVYSSNQADLSAPTGGTRLQQAANYLNIASGLNVDTTYYYRISALSASGEGEFADSSFTTHTCLAPTAPTDFHGAAASGSVIDWSWTLGGSSPTDIYFHTGTSSLGNTATSYQETGLNVNQPYTRYVRFANSNGENQSNIATVYTLANTPGKPTLTTPESNMVNIQWSANGNPDGTRYAVYNVTLDQYVRAADGALMDIGQTDWQLWADWNNGNVNNVGLMPNQEYEYYVIARNGQDIATDPSLHTAITTIANVPDAPTVTAGSWDSSLGNYINIQLNTNNNPGGTEYKIERKIGDGAWSVYQDWVVGADDDHYQDTNRLADTIYQYRVTARNTTGISTIPSEIGSAMTAPSKVTNPDHIYNTATSITWSWTTNPVEPEGYKVYDYYDYDGGICTNDVRATPNFSTDYTALEGNLGSNSVYSRCIRAYRGEIYGEPSDGVSANTGVNIPNKPILLAGDRQISIKIERNSDDASNQQYAISCNGSTGTSWLNKGTPTSNVCTGTQEWHTYLDWGGSSGIANTGLGVNALYSYAIFSKNQDNDVVGGEVASAYTLANIPSQATHTSNTTNSITWSWNANSNPNGTEYYASIGGISSGWMTATTWTSQNLSSANTSYTLSIKARNKDLANEPIETGTISASAYTSIENPTGVSLVSSKPDILEVNILGDFTNLSTGSSGIRYCNVTRSQCSDWLTAKQNWSSTGLTQGQSYNFSVQSKNADGEAGDEITSSFTTTAATQLLLKFPGQTFVPGEGLQGVPEKQIAGQQANVTTYAVDSNYYVDNSAQKVVNLNTSDTRADLPVPSGTLESGQKDFTVILKTSGVQSVVASASDLPYAQQTLRVDPSTCSSTLSQATLNYTTLTAGNNAELSIVLMDGYENLLANHQISVTSNHQEDIITYYSDSTDISGAATVYVKSNTAHTSTLFIRDVHDNVTLATSPQITFTAPPEGPDTTAPIARITAPDRIISGEEATFDASGSIDNVAVTSYLWDFGDQTQSTSTIFRKKYDSTGRYTVTLTVRDAAENQNTITKLIEVVPPAPVITSVTKSNGDLLVKGTSVPLGIVTATIHSEPIVVQAHSTTDGRWGSRYLIDSKLIEGTHTVNAVVSDTNGMLSDPSADLIFNYTKDNIITPTDDKPTEPDPNPPSPPDNPPVTPDEPDQPADNPTPPKEEPIIPKIVKRVKEIFTQENLSKPATAVDVGAAVAVTSVVAMAAAPASNALTLFSLRELLHFFNLPFLYFRNRRRKKWGQVIEAGSGVALGNVAVSLIKIDNGTEKIIAHTLTDRSGNYAFVAAPGLYKIQVDKDNYHPVILDGYYTPGSILQINDQNTGLIDINVAMTLNNSSLPAKLKTLRIINIVTKVLNILSLILLMAGTGFAILNMYKHVNKLSIGVLVFYMVVWALSIKGWNKKSPWGKVVENETSEAIPLALIRILNDKNQLEKTVVTNEMGKYSAILGSGVYKLLVVKQGYKMPAPLEINTKDQINTIDVIVRMRKAID